MLGSLRKDRRGMILVMAIPMAAIMVGALWYLATVGDAVIYRERLQDAADATAFENAVVHARGMNAVALLNMLMAMFLAVIVLIRAVELVLAAGLIFFGVTAGPLSTVVNLDLRVSDRIGRAVEVLSQVEKGVAVATPTLSTALATAHNTSFYSTHEAASAAATFSHAVMPAMIDKQLKVHPRDRWLLTRGAQGGAPRLGTLLVGGGASDALPSLPLEEDDFGKVCQEAIDFIPNQIFGVARRMGVPGPAVWAFEKGYGLVSGFLGSYLSGIFCGSIESGAAELISDAVESVCEGKLPEDTKSEQQVSESEGDAGIPGRAPDASLSAEKPRQTNGGKPGRGSSAGDCKAEVDKKLKSSVSDPDKQRPARVWAPAANGNVLFQTWSVATSGGPKFKHDDARGMEMMAPRRDATINADPMATAEAEYYFDCSYRNFGWGECKPDAMWALGWSARMRRFWWPLKELERAGDVLNRFMSAFAQVERLVRNGVGDYGGNTVQDVGSAASTGLLTKDLVQSLSGPAPEFIH